MVELLLSLSQCHPLPSSTAAHLPQSQHLHPFAGCPGAIRLQCHVEGPSNESAVAHSSSPCQSNGLCRQGPAVVAGVAMARAFFVAVCAGVDIWACARWAKALKKWDNLAATSEIVKTPREFSYRQLSIATLGFDQSRIIGHGAFGTVYKGIIPETGAMVAVKRCIQGGGGDDGEAQARAEFLSELSIIASLRHWC